MALLIAGLALGGPLAGMMLVSLGGHSYMHLLPEYAPLPLSLAILSVGGTAVGLALLPSFFFGAVCGYVLPNFWPYLAASSGLAWATALGLGLGRLFSTSLSRGAATAQGGLVVSLPASGPRLGCVSTYVHCLAEACSPYALCPDQPGLARGCHYRRRLSGQLPCRPAPAHAICCPHRQPTAGLALFTQSPRTAVGTPALPVPPHRVGLCKPQSRAADRCIETSPFTAKAHLNTSA